MAFRFESMIIEIHAPHSEVNESLLKPVKEKECMMPAASGGKAPSSIYVVAVHRTLPGHRAQLQKVLSEPNPNAKTPIATVVLSHLEGGPWTFVEIDRYDSWQDLATDAAASTNDPGWTSVRDHSAFHHDTLADRVVPK